MTFRCKWCENDIDTHARWRYCSDKCEHAALVYAMERWDALMEGEDPPSKADIDRRFRRAERWDPDAMQARINELTSGEPAT